MISFEEGMLPNPQSVTFGERGDSGKLGKTELILSKEIICAKFWHNKGISLHTNFVIHLK